MVSEIKTIGVLTSGGDASGMNCAVRAVVRSAISSGMEVFGINRGYEGLIHGDFQQMEIRSVSEILHRGGTILYSARSPEFQTPEGLERAIRNCKQFGLQGIVVIGGDGSFRGASALSLKGIPCVGIPGTIDNDISASDYTIGVDTALNTIIDAVDKVRDTSHSHDRCSLIEVMGRDCGYLALHAGVASGAMAILVPEIPIDLQKDVVEPMQKMSRAGKKHFIIIAAEGIDYPGGVAQLVKDIENATGVVTRATVLGYVQRGGSPSAKDRVIATMMGVHAVDLLAKGIGNRVVVQKNGQIVDFDIAEALKMTKPFDKELYELNKRISL
ncbi:MAG TPA: 6-phosphofructokinase [Oscillospiraceae bacterium]|nr:6-phosphofructokinase [Oscillospiraceae bacterium]HPS33763.1 6-phosphofructokinase [Oscillospiraceae bacterium]